MQELYSTLWINICNFASFDLIELIFYLRWQLADGSLTRDAGWKMHQRIESHGELLRYLAKYSGERLDKGQSIPDEVVQTIVRFVHYLYIQGNSPQSCFCKICKE